MPDEFGPLTVESVFTKPQLFMAGYLETYSKPTRKNRTLRGLVTSASLPSPNDTVAVAEFLKSLVILSHPVFVLCCRLHL